MGTKKKWYINKQHIYTINRKTQHVSLPLISSNICLCVFAASTSTSTPTQQVDETSPLCCVLTLTFNSTRRRSRKANKETMWDGGEENVKTIVRGYLCKVILVAPARDYFIYSFDVCNTKFLFNSNCIFIFDKHIDRRQVIQYQHKEVYWCCILRRSKLKLTLKLFLLSVDHPDRLTRIWKVKKKFTIFEKSERCCGGESFIHSSSSIVSSRYIYFFLLQYYSTDYKQRNDNEES